LLAVLLAAGICALVDTACRVVLPKSELLLNNEGARAFLSAAEAPDIQILGDSVVLRGLLASALGTDSVYVRNDAVWSSRPPTTYYLLKRQFADGRIPKAIILAHVPMSFDDPFTARLAGTFAQWRELPEVYALASDWTEALYGTLARLSYMLMHRAEFRQLLVYGNYEFFVTRASTGPVYRTVDDLEMLESYFGSPVPETARGDEVEEAHVRDSLRRFEVIDEVDTYFRKILALARQHDVKVYWMTMPVSDKIAEVRQPTAFDRNLLAYLEPFERRGELTVLQGEPRAYDDYMFDEDLVHPNPYGTLNFSCDMRRHAETLRAAVVPALHEHAAPSEARAAALARQEHARVLLDELCASRSPRTHHPGESGLLGGISER
jgi:hypothetical protein